MCRFKCCTQNGSMDPSLSGPETAQGAHVGWHRKQVDLICTSMADYFLSTAPWRALQHCQEATGTTRNQFGALMP